MKKYNNHIIYEKNLINNVKVHREVINKEVLLCAMVKANAYGHGVKDICNILKNMVDYFGVATINEAYEIRKNKIQTPIIVVGVANLKYIKWCAQNNVDITITSIEEIKYIIKHFNFSKPINVHLKINTGLNRIGFNNVNEVINTVNIINKNSFLIKLKGLFTHFATKIDDVDFLLLQNARFNNFLSAMQNVETAHCCNSFTTLNLKDLHKDMVRCGFSLYGYEKTNKSLKPILRITSKILFIHNVKKGESIGYDRDYICDDNKKIGVVSLGYADGFDRKLSNIFKVLINGCWVNVVGLICMDVFMVDLTDVSNVKIGDEVVILGKSGNYELTIHDYAKALNTSPYDVLLKFNYRRMNKIIIKD